MTRLAKFFFDRTSVRRPMTHVDFLRDHIGCLRSHDDWVIQTLYEQFCEDRWAANWLTPDDRMAKEFDEYLNEEVG